MHGFNSHLSALIFNNVSTSFKWLSHTFSLAVNVQNLKMCEIFFLSCQGFSTRLERFFFLFAYNLRVCKIWTHPVFRHLTNLSLAVYSNWVRTIMHTQMCLKFCIDHFNANYNPFSVRRENMISVRYKIRITDTNWFDWIGPTVIYSETLSQFGFTGLNLTL